MTPSTIKTIWKRYKTILYLISSILFLSSTPLNSQDNSLTEQLGLLGNTSLVFVPTAYITPENNLSVGYSHIPKTAALIRHSQENGVGESLKFVNLGYLSFLEITLRLTKPYQTKNTFGIGDRSYFVKIQALKESKYLPALAIGMHDWFTQATHFHSSYFVASKNFHLFQKSVTLQSHLGYGFPIHETNNNYLIGLFGGLNFSWKFLSLLAEYDAENFHTGLKINIKNFVFLQSTLLNMKEWGGGIHLRFRL